MKPRVILDIGFLGHGFDFSAHQRGVHRVLRHLFDGLLRSNECELSFVATSNLAGAHDFLAALGLDPAVRLRSRTLRLVLSRWSRSITRRVHRTLADRSLPARGSRRVLSELNRLLKSREHVLAAGQLGDADIYHSPHAPFPEAVRNHSGLRRFITIHDLITVTHPEYFSDAYRAFARKLLDCLTETTYVFCVSEFVRTEALRLTRLRPENVFTTPLAADREKFHPVTDAREISAAGKRYGIPEGPYFLALSSHDRHKNFGQLIDCFGRLISSGEIKGYNLVIAGPNPERSSIVEEAVERFPETRGRIVVTGYLAEEDLAPVYSGATAFLFPSLAEGFGIPPLEAMQCGTPVIGSNTSSIPEVVGPAGILLPPTDRDAWCQAMISMVGDSSLRTELGRKSIQRAAEFSWERFAGETLRGYRASMER